MARKAERGSRDRGREPAEGRGEEPAGLGLGLMVPAGSDPEPPPETRPDTEPAPRGPTEPATDRGPSGRAPASHAAPGTEPGLESHTGDSTTGRGPDSEGGDAVRGPAPALAPRRATTVVVALVAVAAAVVFGAQAWQAHQRGLDEPAPVAAARQVAEDVTSASAATAPEDIRRLLDASTGGFRIQVAEAQTQYTQALAQGISSRGTVVAAGLDGPVTDSARVLDAVSTQFTSPDAPQGAEQTQQLVITMAHMPDGRWLASALDSLPDTAP